jgi:hypothetical protein
MLARDSDFPISGLQLRLPSSSAAGLRRDKLKKHSEIDQCPSVLISGCENEHTSAFSASSAVNASVLKTVNHHSIFRPAVR